jgi:hypothetical protein
LNEFAGENSDGAAEGAYPIDNDINEPELLFIMIVQYSAQFSELTAWNLPARVLVQISQPN